MLFCERCQSMSLTYRRLQELLAVSRRLAFEVLVRPECQFQLQIEYRLCEVGSLKPLSRTKRLGTICTSLRLSEEHWVVLRVEPLLRFLSQTPEVYRR